MNWQLLILLQTILAGGSVISLRVLAKDRKTAKASVVVNAILYIGLYIAVIAMLPRLGGVVHSQDLAKYWWRFIAGGIAFALTNIFTYKTLVYFDAAIASIAGSLNAVFTIVGAALVLDEKLSLVQALGAVIVASAIVYGVLATNDTRKKHVRRSVKLGLTFALLAGICYGAAIVNEKSLLEHMNASSYVVYGIGGQFGMSILAALILQPKQLYLIKSFKVIKWSLVAGILRGLAGFCFILSEVRSNNVALVTVISNFKIIVVIFLGWWLLKERRQLTQKLVAGCTSIVGLAVMFWQ